MFQTARTVLLTGACLLAGLAIFFPLSAETAEGFPVQMGPSGGISVMILLAALLMIRLPEHFPSFIFGEIIGLGSLWLIRAMLPLIAGNIGTGYWLLAAAGSALSLGCVVSVFMLPTVSAPVARWLLAAVLFAGWAGSLWILLYSVTAASAGIGI